MLLQISRHAGKTLMGMLITDLRINGETDDFLCQEVSHGQCAKGREG
jgi:hypothetical protein